MGSVQAYKVVTVQRTSRRKPQWESLVWTWRGSEQGTIRKTILCWREAENLWGRGCMLRGKKHLNTCRYASHYQQCSLPYYHNNSRASFCMVSYKIIVFFLGGNLVSFSGSPYVQSFSLIHVGGGISGFLSLPLYETQFWPCCFINYEHTCT